MNRIFDEDIRFIDLFAGIGGFHIAMESYGAKCVFASEIDKYAIQTYTYNHLKNNEDIMHGDITKIEAKDIPEHEILCAGFPCQPFSISGLQKGFEDSRGTLFFDVMRIVEYHKPMIVFLENVANLKKHNEGKTIKCMKNILEESGYNVYIDVLNASDFGVPQARKRVYFVAFRKDLKVIKFIFPKGNPNLNVKLEDVLENEVDEKYYIVRDDINLKSREDIDRLIEKKSNEPIRIGTINKGGQGDRIYSTKGHAITLSANGGGAGAKTGAYLVNGIIRKLTPREGLRVQGFPESFKFPVSNAQAYKQLGNSVAIPVLKSILESICNLEELRGITTDDNIINFDGKINKLIFEIEYPKEMSRN